MIPLKIYSILKANLIPMLKPWACNKLIRNLLRRILRPLCSLHQVSSYLLSPKDF